MQPSVRVIVSKEPAVGLETELCERLKWLARQQARLTASATSELRIELSLQLAQLQAETRSYKLILSAIG